jgi:hypothetical protein
MDSFPTLKIQVQEDTQDKIVKDVSFLKPYIKDEIRAETKLDKRDDIKWPTTPEEWLTFDMNKIPAGTEMPFHKVEHPPEKYIINGVLKRHLIPKEKRRKYMLPWQCEEIEVPRNPDGTIIIVDHKQVEIDKLKAQLEALPEGKQLEKIESQQKQIDMLQENLITVINQLNELTKKKLK